MVRKVIVVLVSAVLWGLGANVDIGVAFGKGYGTAAFIVGAILALALLIRKGFILGKDSTDLWVLMFRGLAVEALFFPIANLIMEYVVFHAMPFEVTKALLIQSGLIAAFLAAVFLFNAHLLSTKIRQLNARLEERKQNKESKEKGHEG